MLRASVILKNTRLDKGYEFFEVSKKTKIPQKYLEAFESDRLVGFPEEPYCSLMVKDYAEFLGLNGTDILSLFRRDFEVKRKTVKSKKIKISITPKFTFVFGILALIVVFFGYLVSEYLKFNRPPELKVNWPENMVITSESIEISGTTNPESTVRINDDLVIVDTSGSFQKKVSISTSEAKVVVTSQSPSGKTTTDQKTFKVEK